MTADHLPSEADIVVIGAGVLGASVAFHLRRLGREVVLIDRGPLAAETSSQGAGFLCSVRPTVPSTRLVRYSTAFYARFEAETGYRIDLHPTGGLRIALSERWLDALLSEAAAGVEAGGDTHRLTPDEIRRLVPSMACDGIVGGTFTPEEGYVTATRDIGIGLARAAARNGATVRTHVEVRDLVLRPDGGADLGTSAGPLRAGKVVLAANAGAWPLMRRLGLSYPSYPLLHECAVYALPSDLPADMPTIRIGECDLYLRHEAGGLMVGGVGRNPDGPPPDAAEGRFRLDDVRVEPEELVEARRRAGRFFPGLAKAQCFREQRGLAMVAPDLEPVAGEWQRDLYVVSADLRGVQSAPGLGLMVAQLVAGGASEFDAAAYDPRRFAGLADSTALRRAAQDGLRPKPSEG